MRTEISIDTVAEAWREAARGRSADPGGSDDDGPPILGATVDRLAMVSVRAAEDRA